MEDQGDNIHPFILLENIDVGEEVDDTEDDSASRGSSDGEAGEDEARVDVHYDINLPMQHAYLGTDLEELSGRTYLEDNSVQTLLVLTAHQVLLCPGQVLPLMLFRPMEVATAKRIIDNNRIFGVINVRLDHNSSPETHKGALGTTCEVRSYKEDEDELSGISTMLLKAEGRQRFELLEYLSEQHGFAEVRVRILPETFFGNPIRQIRCRALRAMDSASRKSRLGGEKYEERRGKLRYNYEGGSSLTTIPPWLLERMDLGNLMHQIRGELTEWSNNVTLLQETGDPAKLNQCDPVTFSFWAIANLPIDDKLREKLFASSSVTERLLHILRVLRRRTAVLCKECRSVIAERKAIFSMSVDGPQGTYINQHGHMHELLTVYKVEGVYSRGLPTAVYSWFPGYEWTCITCIHCHVHLGWSFTASRSGLTPRIFYGLTRGALKFAILSKRDSQPKTGLVWLAHSHPVLSADDDDSIGDDDDDDGSHTDDEDAERGRAYEVL